MNKTIVIYHGGCRDGFCAAWVYNKYYNSQINEVIKKQPDNDKGKFGYFNGVEYHPGFYGQEPPDVKDKNVIILDFCYPLEVMKQIIKNSNSVHWIDHHKTAQPFVDYLRKCSEPNNDIGVEGALQFSFDNNRSGAGLTWDYFFPSQPRPWIVDYVEDRDLWAKKLPSSDIINAYISVLEFDFKVWDLIEEHMTVDTAEKNGIIAIAKTEQYVREVCKNVYFVDILKFEKLSDKFGDVKEHSWSKIPTVNICQVDCSEVLAHLLKLYPLSAFSLYWFKRADGMYQYGLRSIGDFDVSTVAKLFGGGGHRNAAGFQLNYLLEELK
jgi:oligoribonuclease NrnB/cAMP/cGMP phosphodiesterase (DHH superfamily)